MQKHNNMFSRSTQYMKMTDRQTAGRTDGRIELPVAQRCASKNGLHRPRSDDDDADNDYGDDDEGTPFEK